MEIRETSDSGKPIIASAPDSPHAAHYRKIAAGVLDALDLGKADAPQIIFEWYVTEITSARAVPPDVSVSDIERPEIRHQPAYQLQ